MARLPILRLPVNEIVADGLQRTIARLPRDEALEILKIYIGRHKLTTQGLRALAAWWGLRLTATRKNAIMDEIVDGLTTE